MFKHVPHDYLNIYNKNKYADIINPWCMCFYGKERKEVVVAAVYMSVGVCKTVKQMF